MDLLERLELEHPVVQAGMGGGVSGAELAAAVSRAGGLGTVGIAIAPRAMQAELERARGLAPGRPIAANLLVPFTRRAHVDACIAAGARCVTLFCGYAPAAVARLKEAGAVVLHQVGTVPQAKRALADGADGIILQGREAGGHLLGVAPGLELLPLALEAAHGAPVLLAGGIADGADVRRALAAGAAAAVAGTRFLLTEECGAHPAYKERALGASETVETYLFGMGWHERHRVLPNAATRRWCRDGSRGPAAVLALNRVSAPLLRRLPGALAELSMRRQSVGMPLYGPAPPLRGMDERLLEVTPLYAGSCAARIEAIVPAAAAVAELAGT